jgi:beta-N-acetylhexosaminidase
MRPRLNIIGLIFVVLGMLLSGCAQAGGPTTTAPPTTEAASASSTTTSAPAPSPTTTKTEFSDAQQLLQNMTLTEKAAQVMLIAFDGTTPSPGLQTFIADHPPGGVLLLERNVTSATQVRRLTAELQEAARQLPSVGLFVAVDQEGGTVQRIKYQVPDVPSARSLGQGSTPVEAAALADKTATGLLPLGVNMNLAPVADVVAGKSSFLYLRTYSSDAAVVSVFVTAVVNAYQDAGLISTVKHFPGHGSAQGNTHAGAVVSSASLEDYEAIHLPPFRAAISAGVEAVMIAHVVANAYDPDRPSSSSPIVIEELLRIDLGFRGLVVADDIEMAAAGAASDSAQSGRPAASSAAFAVDALRAGCDLLISTGTLTGQRLVIDAITAAVRNGSLEQSRLDEAVLRILDLKLRHSIAAAM